jgi:hypothetical protein
MSEFIDYSKSLMEAAKGFCSYAEKLPDGSLKQAFLRASLLHAFSFLEAHLNYMAEHFHDSSMFSVNEKGILLEKEVIFDDGEFQLSQKAKFSRMTDRIELLLTKCASDPSLVKGQWYSQLKASIKIRNALVHPKEAHALNDTQLREVLEAILEAVNCLYKAVFKKGLPYTKRGISGGLALEALTKQ